MRVDTFVLEEKEKEMRENIKQVLQYILTGGLTTAVNYVIYFILLESNTNYLAANTCAWIGAVLFAYFANRRYVFHSAGRVMQEMISFASLRFVTLVLENVLLLLLIDFAGITAGVSKISVGIVTVCLNYFACKNHVFQKGGAVSE